METPTRGHHTEKRYTGRGGHCTYFLNRGTNRLEYFYKFHLPLTKLLQTCVGIYKDEVQLMEYLINSSTHLHINTIRIKEINLKEFFRVFQDCSKAVSIIQ